MATFPYDRSALLTLKNPDYVADLERFVLGAYESDVGTSGSISAHAHRTRSEAECLCSKKIQAVIVAKSSGIFCGELEARWFLRRVASRVRYEFLIQDGDATKPGTPFLRLSGNAETIFAVERTLLNTLQRLSGIATLTSQFVEKAAPCRVAATRKTLYGLLDKRAVVVGGGLTHRLNFHDAPMFKTNHLKLIGFDWDRLIGEFEGLPKKILFATIEVTNFEQARAILQRRGELGSKLFLLFDNLDPRELKKGIIKLAKPKNVYFEASGGITLDNVSAYAKTGVDVLSIGALTHSTPAVDFSLRVRGI